MCVCVRAWPWCWPGWLAHLCVWRPSVQLVCLLKLACSSGSGCHSWGSSSLVLSSPPHYCSPPTHPPRPARSHWRSRTVPCPHGSGRPACETVLLHFEDFRINERLARCVGVGV